MANNKDYIILTKYLCGCIQEHSKIQKKTIAYNRICYRCELNTPNKSISSGQLYPKENINYGCILFNKNEIYDISSYSQLPIKIVKCFDKKNRENYFTLSEVKYDSLGFIKEIKVLNKARFDYNIKNLGFNPEKLNNIILYRKSFLDVLFNEFYYPEVLSTIINTEEDTTFINYRGEIQEQDLIYNLTKFMYIYESIYLNHFYYPNKIKEEFYYVVDRYILDCNKFNYLNKKNKAKNLPLIDLEFID